jgi:putative hydrolase of the HAD superfamily
VQAIGALADEVRQRIIDLPSLPAMLAPIRAIIFDFDGLLVDTESVGYHTWWELFDQHGHQLPIERYAQVVGTDFNQSYDPRRDLEQLTGKAFDWDEIEIRRRQRERELHLNMRPLPGVLDRLHEGRALGLPRAVASSSPRSWVEPWLRDLDLRDHFNHVTTVDDTGKVKPDPSLFLHAAEKLNVDPVEVLVFEDSLNGLRAAQAAGMRCIVAPGPMTQHLDFAGAWLRVMSLMEVSLRDMLHSLP